MKRDNHYIYNDKKFDRLINKKIVYAVLMAFMMVVATGPMVMAATIDSITITFDPDGDIDIDVNISSYDFGGIVGGTWSNTTGNYFTLYNNGTVAMDTQIRTNDTTEEGDMILNESGVAPAQNQYAFYISDLTSPNYVNNTYGDEFDLSLSPLASKAFDIGLLIGNLSANHSSQTTTIYFQGTQS